MLCTCRCTSLSVGRVQREDEAACQAAARVLPVQDIRKDQQRGRHRLRAGDPRAHPRGRAAGHPTLRVGCAATVCLHVSLFEARSGRYQNDAAPVASCLAEARRPVSCAVLAEARRWHCAGMHAHVSAAPQAFEGTQGGAFDAQWLLDYCRALLHKAAKAEKASQAVIAGAMAGLTSALSVCPVRGVACVALPQRTASSSTSGCSDPRRMR